MTVAERVIDCPEVQFPFDGKPVVTVEANLPKCYGTQLYVDPFPGYAHNRKLVEETLARVEAIFPVKLLPYLFILHHEETSRINGHTSRFYYEGEYGYPYIVLSGKRIPPHPAMTRYLVSHEYGHVLRWVIERGMGFKADSNELYEMYAELRQMTPPSHYGARTWHRAVGEVFANDFRVILCGIECEFWPHEVEFPLARPKVCQFWQDARDRFMRT